MRVQIVATAAEDANFAKARLFTWLCTLADPRPRLSCAHPGFRISAVAQHDWSSASVSSSRSVSLDVVQGGSITSRRVLAADVPHVLDQVRRLVLIPCQQPW